MNMAGTASTTTKAKVYNKQDIYSFRPHHTVCQASGMKGYQSCNPQRFFLRLLRPLSKPGKPSKCKWSFTRVCVHITVSLTFM